MNAYILKDHSKDNEHGAKVKKSLYEFKGLAQQNGVEGVCSALLAHFTYTSLLKTLDVFPCIFLLLL